MGKRASPEDDKILSVKRQVGSIIYTTGREHVGPSGGVWVEIDSTKDEKTGWLLTHGRTMGMDTPLLWEADEEDRPIDPGDERSSWEGKPGKRAPMKDWSKLTAMEPEFVR